MPLPSSCEVVSERLPVDETACVELVPQVVHPPGGLVGGTASIEPAPQVVHPPGGSEAGLVIGEPGSARGIGGRVRFVSGTCVDRQNCWGGKCDVSEDPSSELLTEKLCGKLPIVSPGWCSSTASESPTRYGPPDWVSRPPVIVSRTSNSASAVVIVLE